jgi:hypothetical protein
VQVEDILYGKSHRLFEGLLRRSAHGITLSFLATLFNRYGVTIGETGCTNAGR